MIKENTFNAMITQHAWMFLTSFEKLRTKILLDDLTNMAHLGARAFEEIGGEVVQTTAFILSKRNIDKYIGQYARLVEPTTQQGKEDMYLAKHNIYTYNKGDFLKIPGAPLAYWISDKMSSVFDSKPLSDFTDVKKGISTSKNDLFLRMWYEVLEDKIGFYYESAELFQKDSKKWAPINKGGAFNKWYGNNDYVVNWEHNGNAIKKYPGSSIRNERFYFGESITWTDLSNYKPSFRYNKCGFVHDVAGPCVFSLKNRNKYLLGLLNSIVTEKILEITSPSMHFNVGATADIPTLIEARYMDEINSMVEHCIEISKSDWDSFETSWDFACHPLVDVIAKNRVLFDDISDIDMAECYLCWENECNERFNQLKANEEELNRIFIDIYGLQDELTPEVEDKDITVQKADLERDVRSFISFAVGCMLGRYSLDVEGLAFAGGEWDSNKYVKFNTDEDNVIPICDDEYFEDDIVGRFVDFVKTVYGENSLESNLHFIADALGGSGTPREVIRKYFMNDFYKDHCKIYQKRPIYWLFDSGKKGGFKALIYMHRYQPDTIARIRTDYVHEQQSRYRTAIADVENRMQDASTSERVKLNKKLKKLNEQAEEIRLYEEKIHHFADQMISIDLDDGVKVNYAKFEDVLAKVK